MGVKILFSGIFADGIYKIEATLLLYTQFMQVCVWGAFLVEIRILQCSIGSSENGHISLFIRVM